MRWTTGAGDCAPFAGACAAAVGSCGDVVLMGGRVDGRFCGGTLVIRGVTLPAAEQFEPEVFGAADAVPNVEGASLVSCRPPLGGSAPVDDAKSELLLLFGGDSAEEPKDGFSPLEALVRCTWCEGTLHVGEPVSEAPPAPPATPAADEGGDEPKEPAETWPRARAFHGAGVVWRKHREREPDPAFRRRRSSAAVRPATPGAEATPEASPRTEDGGSSDEAGDDAPAAGLGAAGEPEGPRMRVVERHRPHMVIVGGQAADGSLLSDVWSYDVMGGQWTRHADLDAPVAHCSVASLADGTSLVLTGPGPVRVLDGLSWEWRTLPNTALAPRCWHSSVAAFLPSRGLEACGDSSAAAASEGGEPGGKAAEDRADPAADADEPVPLIAVSKTPEPTPPSTSEGARRPSNARRASNARRGSSSKKQAAAPPEPAAETEVPAPKLGTPAPVGHEERVVLFGGTGAGGAVGALVALNVAADHAAELATDGAPPEPRFSAALVASGGLLYVLGGSSAAGARLGDAAQLDVTARRMPRAVAQLVDAPGGVKFGVVELEGLGRYEGFYLEQEDGPWCQGEGTLTFPEGDTLRSEAWSGRGAAEGTLTYRGGGGEYTGELNAALQRHGEGVQRDADGGEYSGAWRDDARHGEGVQRDADGGEYSGAWRDGARDGEGVQRFADGGEYSGAWRADQPSGVGEMSAPDGEVYRGDFVAGKRHGQGVVVDRHGSTWEGSWRSGRLNGAGTHVCALTRSRYTGKFVAGERCGRGVVAYGNGSRYEGSFAAGLRHGQGRLAAVSGKVLFEGEWDSDEPVPHMSAEVEVMPEVTL